MDKKRNMCDKEVDQLLLSPRWYHRAIDVSIFLLPLPVLQTSLTGCFVGQDLFHRMIRTFGLGPRAQKELLLVNPKGSLKTMRTSCVHLFVPCSVVFVYTRTHTTTHNRRHHTTTHHTPLKTGLFSALTSRINGANEGTQRDKGIKDSADLVTLDTSEGRGEEARTRQVVV